MKELLLVLTLTCGLLGCKTQDTKPDPIKEEIEEVINDIDPKPQSSKCEVKQEKFALCSDGKCSGSFMASFPRTGAVVLESHLASVVDSFDGGNRYFPKTTTEGIQSHLDRSCTLLRVAIADADCEKAYASKYVKVWTPPEGGKAGQGSLGDLKPSLLEEMFTCNMMWTRKTKPKAGEKWLAKFKDKAVVVVMGYETGPGDTKKWIGGCQGEVFYALGAPHQSTLTLGRLIDQSLNPGPVVCE